MLTLKKYLNNVKIILFRSQFHRLEAYYLKIVCIRDRISFLNNI